jgi:DNA polymerase-3 subunit gamma/tau
MRGTTSPRLLLELMCAQVLLPAASTGEKALAARLERIERRIDGLGSEEISAGSPAPGTRSAAATAPPAPAATGAGAARGAAKGAGTAPEAEPAQGAEPAPEAVLATEAPRAREAAAARETRAAHEGPDAREAPASQDVSAPGAVGRGTAQTRVAPARQTSGRGAGAQETAGQDAGGREAAAREAPARSAPSARPGVIDTDTLRQRWPDVLDAVKSERRVAWMLLNTASVDSLEGGVLTVAFAKEGQAKGFAASGHDQVLTGVLANMLGLKVRVRAAVGTVSGAHGARPAPADPAPRAGSSGRAAGRASGGSGTAGPGTAGSGSAGPGTGGPGAARSGGSGPGDATDRPGSIADRPDGPAGRRGAPGGMQGNAGAQPGGFQAHPGQGGPGELSGAGAAAGRASSSPRPPEPQPGGGISAPAPADLEEEWPDDAGPADGGAGPTGMELIERQLGGTIIEEIDEP